MQSFKTLYINPSTTTSFIVIQIGSVDLALQEEQSFKRRAKNWNVMAHVHWN